MPGVTTIAESLLGALRSQDRKCMHESIPLADADAMNSADSRA
jgi:hypothetical protein